MNYKEIMLNQLAADFNTTPDALKAGKNIFTKKAFDSRKRAYENGDAVLQVLCVNGIAVINSADDALLECLQKEYAECNAAWFFEIENIRRLDQILKPFGSNTADMHQYFIPGRNSKKTVNFSETAWYRNGEIEQFRGDNRFNEAFGFNEKWPDRIGLAAMENGEILGMAGASEDSAAAWQIGLNVSEKSRGKGIGSALLGTLEQELVQNGLLPFCGTAPSHTVSLRTMSAAGFVPAWSELYTQKIK